MAFDFRIERGWSFDGYQAWVIDYRQGEGVYIGRPTDIVFEKQPETATRCHLAYDKGHHAKSRRENRDKETGQMTLKL